MQTCKHANGQTETNRNKQTNGRTDKQTYIHNHTYTYTYVHTYIRTYIHTFIYTYIYIYIHIGLHAACVWNGGARSGNTTHDCLDLRVRERRITPPKKTIIINPTARFRRSSLLLQPADGRNLLGSPSVVLGRDDDAMNCRMDEWWWMACVHIHMHLCTHIYIYCVCEMSLVPFRRFESLHITSRPSLDASWDDLPQTLECTDALGIFNLSGF